MSSIHDQTKEETSYIEVNRSDVKEWRTRLTKVSKPRKNLRRSFISYICKKKNKEITSYNVHVFFLHCAHSVRLLVTSNDAWCGASIWRWSLMLVYFENDI